MHAAAQQERPATAQILKSLPHTNAPQQTHTHTHTHHGVHFLEFSSTEILKILAIHLYSEFIGMCTMTLSFQKVC
jgi:hypothetical protein